LRRLALAVVLALGLSSHHVTLRLASRRPWACRHPADLELAVVPARVCRHVDLDLLLGRRNTLGKEALSKQKERSTATCDDGNNYNKYRTEPTTQ